MWWKKNKWKVILPALVAAILAAAFWYGGDAPVSSGQQAESPVISDTKESPVDSSGTGISQEIPDEDTPTGAADTTAEAERNQSSNADTAETAELPDDEPDTTSKAGQDLYQTDPVPAGRPLPAEPQDVTISTNAYTCTMSISCAAILDNMDLLDPEKVELVPEDGWILEPTTVTFYEGESVFNILQRVCKQRELHMEYMNTPIYNSAYIEGINNLYEFDCGELSGWMYEVNGWFPNYGCSRYQLMESDVIEWVYTCDLGADVGGEYAAGNGRSV